MEDIDHYEIPIYNFPYDVEEDDEETIQDNMELRVSFSLLPWRLIVTFKNIRPCYLFPL
jgi:cell division control protein 11